MRGEPGAHRTGEPLADGAQQRIGSGHGKHHSGGTSSRHTPLIPPHHPAAPPPNEVNGPFDQRHWTNGPLTHSGPADADMWFRVNGPFVQRNWANGPLTHSRHLGDLRVVLRSQRTVRRTGLGERAVHPGRWVPSGRGGGV
ncbi:hypothetical protein GCM10027271_38030 [Saccharopolyspora gloriosae]